MQRSTRALSVADGQDTTLTPTVLIRFVWWAIAIPGVTALGGPVVANSPRGPGAMFVAARYYVSGAMARTVARFTDRASDSAPCERKL